MSEDEAKSVRCCGPMPHNTGLPVRQADTTTIYMCSGSACMAWRKNHDPDRIRAGISEYGGHCGYAGKP